MTDTVKVLNDDTLREIETRPLRTVHYDHPFVPLSEVERDALCQTVRALRKQVFVAMRGKLELRNERLNQILNQIRERADLPSRWTPTWADVNFLLLLLDSQAPGTTWSKEPPKVDGVYWWRMSDNDPDPDICETDLQYGTVYDIGEPQGDKIAERGGEWLGPITPSSAHAAATRMRDRCVQKVKSVAQTHREMAEKFKGKEMGELQAIRAEECDTLVGILQSITPEVETEAR